MSTIPSLEHTPLPQQAFSPVAGILSYLVPGLGQIVQGRVGKGLLFLVCLYGLFFFGQSLGGWRNVYVGDAPGQRPPPPNRTRLLENIADRARFFCQFWIGAAAWPALIQHFAPDKAETWFGNYQRVMTEEDMNTQIRNGDKSLDLGWMYTVIAGVLNILVIYDALAGPVHSPAPVKLAPKEPAVV